MLSFCPECKSKIFMSEGKYGIEWTCLSCNFQVDRQHIDRVKKDLDNEGFGNFSNESLVDAIYAILSDEYEDLLLYKLGIEQWLTISKEGRDKVRSILQNRRDRLSAELLDVEGVLFSIGSY